MLTPVKRLNVPVARNKTTTKNEKKLIFKIKHVQF